MGIPLTSLSQLSKFCLLPPLGHPQPPHWQGSVRSYKMTYKSIKLSLKFKTQHYTIILPGENQLYSNQIQERKGVYMTAWYLGNYTALGHS